MTTSFFYGNSQFVLAQEALAENSETQIYTPDYFAQFQPNTAADMVARLPGFNLQDDDNEERGFGQATSNILINGRRPSSKSSDASAILARIPAETVTRIEIIDGASLDIPGLSGQVANIIAASGSLSGNWRYAARFEEGTEPQILEGAVNLSGKRGNLDFVLGLQSEQFTFTDTGPEQFFDGHGALIQDRTEEAAFQLQLPQIDLNLTLNRLNGDVANVNLSGSLRNQNQRIVENFTGITDSQTTGSSDGGAGRDDVQYEISGDYASDVDLFGSGGRLKFIGLYNRSDIDNLTVFNLFLEDADSQRREFLRDEVTTELIGRAEYTWSEGAPHASQKDWAFSIESAFNTLQSTTGFSVDGSEPVDDFVEVKETRVQANITRSWSLNEAINLQASLGAELSEINVVSEIGSADTFFRPKGFISGSYAASPTYTWRGKIERKVGQLDFSDFVSTRNFTDGNANEGNDDIVPDQRWRGELSLERQDDKVLSGTVSAYIDFIEDPIDRILFESGIEGPGNLDSATIYGVNANTTWVMDSIGFKGMRLEASGGLADSRIEDPVTLIDRQVNSTTLWNYNVELRQDIPNSPIAWQANVSQSRASEFFRRDEILDTQFIRPEASLTFIHKTLFGLQWSLTASNLLNFKTQRERTVFGPDDRTDEILRIERFSRQRGRRFSIQINDTF
jgi:hypothetical protein